ncbi:stress response membrane protein YncL [Escherichia coli O167]|nr:stress response membrane protein YncL [Escherichia coli O167]MXF78523.1 stress response membrane protein YncL [Escherichia coli]HBD0239971.1 stress response membrane protein YncL [Escherichia coli]
MNVSSRTVVLINVFAAVGLFTLISMRFGWFVYSYLYEIWLVYLM